MAVNGAAGDISKDEFIAAICRLAESVYDFHERFNIPNISANVAADRAMPRLSTRLVFLMEEVGEHAMDLNRGTIKAASDEMADVAFVAMGTLLELGTLGASASYEVADKNDKKTLRTHMVEASSGKLVKRA